MEAGRTGSCLLVQRSSSNSVAYYRYATTSDPNSGGIYLAANAAFANPLTDKLLVGAVQDLEFRRDVNGTIRVGFDVGTFSSSNLITGGKETDLVRFSTSSLPRN